MNFELTKHVQTRLPQRNLKKTAAVTITCHCWWRRNRYFQTRGSEKSWHLYSLRWVSPFCSVPEFQEHKES